MAQLKESRIPSVPGYEETLTMEVLRNNLSFMQAKEFAENSIEV